MALVFQAVAAGVDSSVVRLGAFESRIRTTSHSTYRRHSQPAVGGRSLPGRLTAFCGFGLGEGGGKPVTSKPQGKEAWKAKGGLFISDGRLSSRWRPCRWSPVFGPYSETRSPSLSCSFLVQLIAVANSTRFCIIITNGVSIDPNLKRPQQWHHRNRPSQSPATA